MEYTVLDIETMPNEDMIDKLPEPTVAIGNLKDEAKIQAKIEEAKQKQIDNMALNPLYGKIACIGYGEKVIVSEYENDLIVEIGHVLSRMQPICTYNGTMFDLPFIYKRAVILGISITPPLSFWTKRYIITPHCDLMQVWGSWKDYEKMDNIAKVILGQGKVDFDVTTIKDLIKTEEGKSKIAEYCKHDLKITKLLFHRMNGILF